MFCRDSYRNAVKKMLAGVAGRASGGVPATYTVQSVMACFSDVMGSLSGTNSWAK
jgi:hypothetical protein